VRSGHSISLKTFNAKCQSVWKMASPNGDTLSQDKAVPFVVNYQMVDTDKEGKISADEFRPVAARAGFKKPMPQRSTT
jgi:Ca2+-binding EF-hand superfamily protein